MHFLFLIQKQWHALLKSKQKMKIFGTKREPRKGSLFKSMNVHNQRPRCCRISSFAIWTASLNVLTLFDAQEL